MLAKAGGWPTPLGSDAWSKVISGSQTKHSACLAPVWASEPCPDIKPQSHVGGSPT